MATRGFDTDTSDPTSYTATLSSDGDPLVLPGSVTLETNGSVSEIDLTVTLNRNVSYDAIATSVSLFTFTNQMGKLEVTSNNALTLNNVLAFTDTTATGNAAILAIGAPNPNADSQAQTGQDVEVTINQNITVKGAGETSIGIPPLTLDPPGFRTAQLSGVTAVSYGLQDANNEHSRAGGTVTVNTSEGATIDVSQTSSSVITAGISATSAAGPAESNYFNEAYGVNVNQGGDITVTADQGMGIFANTTGGQFSISGSSVAVGGSVDVTLTTDGDGMGGASITHTGRTGIGIFALSEVSPINDSSGIPIQGGPVTVTMEKETSIQVGNEAGGSQLSIGILAVSASANQLLNPFSTTTTPLDTNGDGSGGEVKVDNSGTITTYGDSSVGIASLSVGGASMVTTNNPSTNENSYLGSNGAHSGGGRQVTVNNRSDGSIVTQGQGAHGIVAMSAANGGLVNNLQEVFGDDRSSLTGLNIGNGPSSTSGSGHDGGNVTVTNAGSITTGDGSNGSAASIGILAQSIGGGGGNASNKASLFVGDSGGTGGKGGTIDVKAERNSTLTTHDVNSVGILAQSVGGGGGNGGNAEGLFVSVGGRGGSGGDGGTIDITIEGALDTFENHSGGVIAQSIGGGGGHGGAATTTSVLPTPLNFGIGGNAGSSGTGGQTTAIIETDGAITTHGNNSAGLILQSIGGGGGTGGAATSKSADLLSAAFSIGGSGSSGGNGGTVTLDSFGTITTGDSSAASATGAPVNEGADSIGVILQSIGGGGGHGGSAVASAEGFAIGDEDIALALPVSIGGLAGAGGDSEDVTLNHFGSITTWGDGSHGALLQSIGGGGGNGGDSTAHSTAVAIEAASIDTGISQGGRGSGGGNGRSVDVTIFVDDAISGSGTITTNGQNAAGVVAQSIGGGGGNGGLGTANAFNENFSPDEPAAFNFVLAIGGSADGGGDAGPVAIINAGTINTDGSGSQGILAQAIGGGGGNAGGGSVGGGNANYMLDIAVGGIGGGGGKAANDDSTDISVSVDNLGTIQTKQGDSTGILAQSIGGGGGTGGSADIQAPTGLIDKALGLDKSNSYTSDILVGGSGGAGGQGGTVSITNEGSVTTEGVRSYGILAQSISGGGGMAGSANASSNSFFGSPSSPASQDDPDDPENNESYQITIAVGGKGGSGDTGGEVDITNSDTVGTTGYASHGIVAQSVGGGGGIGADGSVDTKADVGLGIDVNQGSGRAANGGTVTVTQDREVSTTGHQSLGVLAQSVGGGGGIGTQGTYLALFTAKPNIGLVPSLKVNLTLGINLNTGDNSDGGTTTVNLGTVPVLGNSTTTTEGDWSVGVLAQSVGAGGGKADTISGSNVSIIPDLNLTLGAKNGNGQGGDVVVASTGRATVKTGTNGDGFGAYGVLAQSIGGGGGMATDASSAATGSMSLGGQSDQVDGDGGSVTVTAGDLNIDTQGTNAHGMVLQSIGGGGGVAGTGTTEPYAESLAGVTPPSMTLGAQDSTGNGQDVSLNGNVSVNTSGNNAFGLVAQSIGGGGGIATSKQPGGSITLGLTADDTSQRQGGTVELTLSNNSTIQTSGIGSHGVVAQSIGGGGGIANPDSGAGFNLAPNPRDATAHGYGQDVTLDLSGDIMTSGQGANGVVAQVIGGGGGLYEGFAGSTGGVNSSDDASKNGKLSITVESGARVHTSGQNANAILAQNVTGNGSAGNNIMITVHGSVRSEAGTGILVDGGADNSLTVSLGGSVVSRDFTQNAIEYQGSETFNISNSGIISGSVFVADSMDADSTFTNNGIFNSGTTVHASMEDNGAFLVGGLNNILQTQMGFGYTQNGSGILSFDVESENSFDQIRFDSASGDFQGNLEITLVDQGRQLRAGDQMVLITAGNGNSFEESFITGVTFLNKADGISLLVRPDQGALVLDVLAVPEPSAISLLLLGGFGWLLRRRKSNSITSH
ncbi:MAG: PEP-CTERM sorting domain-containing protein [Verrucomicrobiota bacterium]